MGDGGSMYPELVRGRAILTGTSELTNLGGAESWSVSEPAGLRGRESWMSWSCCCCCDVSPMVPICAGVCGWGLCGCGCGFGRCLGVVCGCLTRRPDTRTYKRRHTSHSLTHTHSHTCARTHQVQHGQVVQIHAPLFRNFNLELGLWFAKTRVRKGAAGRARHMWLEECTRRWRWRWRWRWRLAHGQGLGYISVRVRTLLLHIRGRGRVGFGTKCVWVGGREGVIVCVLVRVNTICSHVGSMCAHANR